MEKFAEAIMNFLALIVKGWLKIPKVFRFILAVPTAPVWIPAFFVVLLSVMMLCELCAVVKEIWRGI